MKTVKSLIAALVLTAGVSSALKAEGPNPSAPADLAPAGQPEIVAPLTPANLGMQPIPMGTKAICQPGTFQYNCKEIWGVAQGRCGANTWRYTSCKQYKNSAGKWYYQNCGAVQEVCSPPGGAECIPCV